MKKTKYSEQIAFIFMSGRRRCIRWRSLSQSWDIGANLLSVAAEIWRIDAIRDETLKAT